MPLTLFRDFYRDGVAVSLSRVSQELWNYLTGRASHHLSCTVSLCVEREEEGDCLCLAV